MFLLLVNSNLLFHNTISRLYIHDTKLSKLLKEQKKDKLYDLPYSVVVACEVICIEFPVFVLSHDDYIEFPALLSHDFSISNK